LKDVETSFEDSGPSAGVSTYFNFSEHGINQVITRGISPAALKYGMENYYKVVEQTHKLGPTYKFISDKIVIVLNQTGKLITVYSKGGW